MSLAAENSVNSYIKTLDVHDGELERCQGIISEKMRERVGASHRKSVKTMDETTVC